MTILSMEVSLYCPRFVVLKLEEGKARVVFTSLNDRHREALRHERNRTPAGQILSEIEGKLQFLLNAYPIDEAVWVLRGHGVANRDASRLALGVILLTLHKARVTPPSEMTHSRIRLNLTGCSTATAADTNKAAQAMLAEWPPDFNDYRIAITAGAAWNKGHIVGDGA